MVKNVSENKRLFINLMASLIALIVNMGISFFLSPYIINNVGTEAYGFISLANNFVNYASLLTIALNSMAGRFITIKIHQKQQIEANKYFNSVFFANVIISTVLLIPSIIITVYLDKLVNIPVEIVNNVKLLFLFIFFNFILGILGSTYEVATLARNRLDLASKRKIEANILKAVLLIIFFSFIGSNIEYFGITTLMVNIYVFIINLYYTKKLLPEIKISRVFFEIKKVIEVIKSGIWHTVTKLGQILSDGLDLLISNVFISALAMGQLSVAKTISTVVTTLIGTVSYLFQPNLIKEYALDNKEGMVKYLKFGMKITGMFSNISLCFIIAFGLSFYKLWIPTQNIELIYVLTIITLIGAIVSGVIDPLWSVFTITNKLKVNSIVTFGMGLLNIGIVYLLLKTTNMGVLAVAGVSGVTSVIKNLTYAPMYTAKCLRVNKKTFYPVIIRYLFTTIIIFVAFYIIYNIIDVTSWIRLIVVGIVCGIIGLIMNYLLLFNKSEKSNFQQLVLSKLKKN